ncbi:SDR family oxidoreductase [Rhodobacteraceae bacterium D3-12]|nr:SDR family oxidoreductase [Rhodobacteraceae bacterium D3-12]
MKDEVILITGSGKGIGREAALLAASQGAAVAVADIDEAAAAATCAEIGEAQGRAIGLTFDVTDEDSVKSGFDSVIGAFGRLTGLVNNAGGSSLHDGPVTEVPVDEFRRAIELDLVGTFLCCRHGIPLISAAGGGSVVNMASLLGLRGTAGRDAYTAAKGGVVSLTRSMAVEFAADKIRVNAIAPGAVLTERMQTFIEKDPRVQANVAKHLLGLPGPREIAEAIVYLLGPTTRHMTGAIIPIDGGRGVSA